MTDWKAQARAALRRGSKEGETIQECTCMAAPYHRRCNGVCEDAVDYVAAALEEAAAAERADIQKLCVALAPFALDFSQDLTGDEERLLNSQEWGRHCKRAFVALRAIRARERK